MIELKFQKPKAFDGSRDSKALENFIWDLEHYFKVTKQGDGRKLDVATLYLSGDAKLWWRSRQSCGTNGATAVKSWEEMKSDLRKQFLPSNGSWVARGKLK